MREMVFLRWLCSSELEEDRSSSDDMWKTPSEGVLTCFRPFLRAGGDGLGGKATLNGNTPKEVVRGAVFGPSSNRLALERLGVLGYSSSLKMSVMSSHIGNGFQSEVSGVVLPLKGRAGMDCDKLGGIDLGRWGTGIARDEGGVVNELSC